MKRILVIASVVVLSFVLLLVVLGTVFRTRQHPSREKAAAAGDVPAAAPATAPSVPEADHEGQGFLYGRVTTVEGKVLEGRLRFGGTEEAFWSDAFNGVKGDNIWAKQLTPEQVPKEREAMRVFGITVLRRYRPVDLQRRFVARFGDIARIDASGRDVKVTLKSGTMVDLDRFESSDVDDGLRVWDAKEGEVDLDSLRIRSIEFLPTPQLSGVPSRLHGTVKTDQGDFTGFIQWNREACVGSDELAGRSAEDWVRLRFDTIRSIERPPRNASVVTLKDGRSLELSQSPEVGHGNRGLYVDDPRFGRVLIAWGSFVRVDFDDAGGGPAYADFPPPRPLTGTVTTRRGERLTGRLVYDLDESETFETLDAPIKGVDYALPFGLVATIVPSGQELPEAQGGRVTLHSGEELELAREGDLAERNAGMLVFVAGRERPDYVSWKDIAKVELDRPPAMYPPIAAR